MKKEDGGKYVKVSMDGAPYLRKIDMKLYQGYSQLLQALNDMFQVQVGKHQFSQQNKSNCFGDRFLICKKNVCKSIILKFVILC